MQTAILFYPLNDTAFSLPLVLIDDDGVESPLLVGPVRFFLARSDSPYASPADVTLDFTAVLQPDKEWLFKMDGAVLLPDLLDRLFGDTKLSDLVVLQTFNQADSATTIRNTNTGQAPILVGDTLLDPTTVPVWGTIGNHGVLLGINTSLGVNYPAGAQGMVVYESGLPEARALATVAKPGFGLGVVGRYVDTANFLFLQEFEDQIQLGKFQAGVRSVLRTIEQAPKAGDVLELRMEGSTISAYVNDVLMEAAHNETLGLTTGTKHGLMSVTSNLGAHPAYTNTEYDRFEVRRLAQTTPWIIIEVTGDVRIALPAKYKPVRKGKVR